MSQSFVGFRVAARGLIVKDQKLLFVSNDNHYWYLPGGRLEGTESLTACVEREVYEETGLTVKTGALLHVLEAYDIHDHLHKINFYFQATVLNGQISDSWQDTDAGIVQYRKYFSLEEIQQHTNILPRFLANGQWCSLATPPIIYQGFVRMCGFEMINDIETDLIT